MNNLRHKRKYDAMEPPKKKHFQKKKKTSLLDENKWEILRKQTKIPKKLGNVLMIKRSAKQNGTRIQNHGCNYEKRPV